MPPAVANMGDSDGTKEKPATVQREMDLGDLDGSTLDGAVCGEARFHWMRRTGGSGPFDRFRPYAELIVTVVLHLIAQFFQFVLITYFTLGVVAPVVHPFQPVQLANSTKHLTQAILANNYDIVDPMLRTLCAQNVSYPWTHRMMMFVLLAKLLPELSNGAWRLYMMWRIDESENHDLMKKNEEVKQEHYTWQQHQTEPLNELLDKDNKDYTQKEELKATMKYRLEEDVTKEWKHRTLLLDVWGNTQKVNTVPKLTQAAYPIKFIYKEMDEEHYIGTFSIVWKLFTTVFILIPHILMTLYMLKIGSELIASVGTLGKLIKTALKVKFLLGIPEAIFDGYASQDLKDYIDGTVYYAREKRPEQEEATHGIFGMKDGTKFNRNTRWPTWLSIVVKLFGCWFCSFIMYDLGYREIIAFRHLCGDYFDTFAGSVAGPRSFLTAY